MIFFFSESGYYTLPQEKIKKYKNILITEAVLLFKNKKHYGRLNSYQKYKKILSYCPKGIAYEFNFTLSLEHTALAPSYTYCKNLNTLPRKKVLLWVCSSKVVTTCDIHCIKDVDIDWHFLIVENTEEFSKHKGLISLLNNDDFIICAGEFYIKDDNKILWNDQTGTLNSNLDLNSDRMKAEFRDVIIDPILNLFNNRKKEKWDFIYDEFIMDKYCPKINYEELNELYKNKIFLKSYKERL